MPITEVTEFNRQLQHRKLADVIDLLIDLTDDDLAAREDDEWERIATRRFARDVRECE